jgi:DNA adenine methylase
MVKPVLKWVGGKTQILEQVFSKFPKEITNYHEVFLGGGSVLIELLNRIKNNDIKITGTINAYDLNENLINMYNNIKTQPKRLLNRIKISVKKFNSIVESGERNLKPKNEKEAIKSRESYYYWIRNQYNCMKKEERNSCECSAMFIFLNKTCFRGLYRVGPNGFNVPYGNYSNPMIVDKFNLMELSSMIKQVNFYNTDFSNSLERVESNDFIYMDPPYVPENNNSFVGYNMDGFNMEQHKKLFNRIKELKEMNVRQLMSNSDVPMIREYFPNSTIDTIECKRSINSKNPGAKTNEVLVTI